MMQFPQPKLSNYAAKLLAGRKVVAMQGDADFFDFFEVDNFVVVAIEFFHGDLLVGVKRCAEYVWMPYGIHVIVWSCACCNGGYYGGVCPVLTKRCSRKSRAELNIGESGLLQEKMHAVWGMEA